MTANGPNTQSYNYTHMFWKEDLRGPRPKLYTNPNTIMSVLENNYDFSMFSYIIKLAKFEGLFNDCQADVTLFVPSDIEIKKNNPDMYSMVENMDESTAKSIVLFSTLNRKINLDLLSQSPMKYVFTQNTTNKLLLETYENRTYLNRGNAKIIRPDINLSNGMIHIINNILIPESDINVGTSKQF